MTAIVDIEGIGPAYAEKLKAAGLMTTERLLTAGATKAGREKIAADTGISETLVLKWVNHADLFRIKGVAGQYAELLEAAGVDTVVELSNRVPANLQPKLVETNAAKKLVRQVPSLRQVETWVAEAKALGRRVEH
ncbi:MAG: DUF4332 domain-containing protein [Acidimicrobiia bacterium]